MPKNDEVFEDDDITAVDDELEVEVEVESEGDDDDADVDTVAGPVVIAEDDVDEDDGPDTDVELALDEVLAERVRVTTEEEDEDDEPISDPEEKLDANETVLPQQDDEFRCNSCHLLKKNSQLADKKSMLCRDCL